MEAPEFFGQLFSLGDGAVADDQLGQVSLQQRQGDAGGGAAGAQQQGSATAKVMTLLAQALDKALAVEHAAGEAAIGKASGHVAHPKQLGGALELIAQAGDLGLVGHGDDDAGKVLDAPQARPGCGELRWRNFPGDEYGVIAELFHQRVEEFRRSKVSGGVAEMNDDVGFSTDWHDGASW
ncbi:hypothetical protein D9M71_650970 [compost metagenome]